MSADCLDTIFEYLLHLKCARWPFPCVQFLLYTFVKTIGGSKRAVFFFQGVSQWKVDTLLTQMCCSVEIFKGCSPLCTVGTPPQRPSWRAASPTSSPPRCPALRPCAAPTASAFLPQAKPSLLTKTSATTRASTSLLRFISSTSLCSTACSPRTGSRGLPPSP